MGCTVGLPDRHPTQDRRERRDFVAYLEVLSFAAARFGRHRFLSGPQPQYLQEPHCLAPWLSLGVAAR